MTTVLQARKYVPSVIQLIASRLSQVACAYSVSQGVITESLITSKTLTEELRVRVFIFLFSFLVFFPLCSSSLYPVMTFLHRSPLTFDLHSYFTFRRYYSIDHAIGGGVFLVFFFKHTLSKLLRVLCAKSDIKSDAISDLLNLNKKINSIGVYLSHSRLIFTFL